MTEKAKDRWLTQVQMAKSLGDRFRLRAMGVDPAARIGKQVYYDIRSVLNRLVKADQAGSNTDIEVERFRLTRAQAKDQEIKKTSWPKG